MAHKHPGLKISLRACCVLDKGMVSTFPLLLPPQDWSRGVCTDTRGYGVPSVKLVQGTRKALCLQMVCPSISLVSCLLLPPCKIKVHFSTKPCCRNQQGWDAASPTFFLSLFWGWETSHSKRNGRRKLKQEICYWNIPEVCQAPRLLWVRIHNDGITGWERIKNNIFMATLWGYKCYWNMGIWPQVKTT